MDSQYQISKGSLLRAMFSTLESLSEARGRLSSGQRINSSSDDAAGLSLASSLSRDSKLGKVGYRNINDGISLLNYTSASLNALDDVMTRIQEIATSAGHTALSGAQRSALQDEMNQLTTEYNRIVSSTSYNNQNLYTSSGYSGSIQVGESNSSSSRVDFSITGEGTAYGSGTFATPTTLSAFNGPSQVAVADVNGDGIEDIIEANNTANVVTVRRGNGDGTFTTAVSYSLASSTGPRPLAVDDFNNDGKVDIVTYGVSGARIALNNGDGTFGTFTTINSVLSNNTELVTGDFNGDGNLDFAAVADSTSGFMNIFAGSGSGTFTLSQSIAVTMTTARPPTAGDVDGDGDLDLIVGDTSAAFIFRNTGGTFAAASTAVSGSAVQVDLGDVDKDGDLDLLSADASGNLRVSLNNGSGTFSTSVTVAGIGSVMNQIIVSDINSDGVLDVVGAPSAASSAYSVFMGNGDGTFSAVKSRSATNPSTSIALGDLNGDGALDIVGGNYANNAITIALGTATPSSYTMKIAKLGPLDISSAMSAKVVSQQLSPVQTSITNITARVDASLSTFSYAANFATTKSTLLSASADTILNADIASDVAISLSSQILNDTQSALLAQLGKMDPLSAVLLTLKA